MQVILLFTRDLRVHDHPALHEAVATADGVIPMFVLDDALLTRSPNRAHFLAACLRDLDASLRERGAGLIVRRGDAAEEVAKVAQQLGGDAQVWLTQDVSAYAARRVASFREAGLMVREFPGHAIVEAGDAVPAGRNHYRVFTPYRRTWAEVPRRPVLPAPERIRMPEGIDPGEVPDPAGITPDSSELAEGGERIGRALMERYVDERPDYTEVRNLPALDQTTRLSPYLRFGCVSANEAAERLSFAPDLVRQLAWRDFFAQLLAADPTLARRDMRPPEEPWRDDAETRDALDAWRAGQTGLPLVDAGMRQLAREGWMHGRVRMTVGSLLTRRLGVHWRHGLAHFDRYLLDGDVANDAGNWQWVAGTGTDPRRSRVLNPVRQARRFDPDGAYVRRYVEELADMPTPQIIAPWRSESTLFGAHYPQPVVEVNDR